MLAALPGHAQDSTASQLPTYTERTVSQQTLQELQEDPDLNYEVDVPESSWLENFLRWLASTFFQNIDGNQIGETWKVLLYTISGIALIFVVLRLLQVDVTSIWKNSGKGKNTLTAQVEGITEDIHGLNFEEEIRLAQAQGNYQKVVRLYYLLALKFLSDKGYIQFEPGKTNHHYQRELKQAALKNEFQQMGYCFDYVHYGDFDATKTVADYMAEHYLNLSSLNKEVA